MKERIEAYLSRETIAARVAEIGAEISAEHKYEDPLILICVLKGSFVFFADLIRAVNV